MNGLWTYLPGGIILIVIGLLVRRFPMLISGYNTMPAEKRKHMDIDGLSAFMQRHLLIMGAAWIGITALMFLTGAEQILPPVYVAGTLVYVGWILFRAQRYDHNK